MRLPSIEPKIDTNLGTNSKNINREIYAIMERTKRQVEVSRQRIFYSDRMVVCCDRASLW